MRTSLASSTKKSASPRTRAARTVLTVAAITLLLLNVYRVTVWAELTVATKLRVRMTAAEFISRTTNGSVSRRLDPIEIVGGRILQPQVVLSGP